MATLDVELLDESQQRYLTYALSVVNSRALPDARDGLKPVQRRILYAMVNNLRLTPEHHHRKSAAVVGEVLARYHPHGDNACYEALVRMAQSFSFRYPLIDGQGNFGSLDGDAAAAYRYTEARLTPFALEVIGDIGQETVAERPNFDQTMMEPIVLPSRVPHLLVNGATGIAVGMATSIPPHNLRDVVRALLLLLEEGAVADQKLVAVLKGPDFPTGCLILNTARELREIYATGRGAVRMRAEHELEAGPRGKQYIVVRSIPYGVDKSLIVEKIADLIVQKKVPQLVDVRDESTDEVRIVLELATGGLADKAMAYLFKHTPLQTNFNVNLTALIPTRNPTCGRPALLSLRALLQHFLDFRFAVTRCKLTFEKTRLEERIHLLEGVVRILDVLREVIELIRKGEGRQDAALRLQKKYGMSEVQAYFIVDLRLYQLSRTNAEEVQMELTEKRQRVAEIDRILGSRKALQKVISGDLERIAESFGDARRSKIVGAFEEAQVDEEEYVQHEEVFVLVTGDGWLKRVRSSNDPQSTRIREGDSIFFSEKASTRDTIALITNLGNLFITRVFDIAATSGFGEPVQKLFRFQDGEAIAAVFVSKSQEGLFPEDEYLMFSARGMGFRLRLDLGTPTKKIGKRLMKVREGDRLVGVVPVAKRAVALFTTGGYNVVFPVDEIPLLSGAGKGVILQKVSADDRLTGLCFIGKQSKVKIRTTKGKEIVLPASDLFTAERGRRGKRVVKDGIESVRTVES